MDAPQTIIAAAKDEGAFRTVVGLLLLALATPVGAVVILPAAYALVTGELPLPPS